MSSESSESSGSSAIDDASALSITAQSLAKAIEAKEIAEKRSASAIDALAILLGALEVKIPVSPGIIATLRLPENGLSAEEWKTFSSILKTMMPGLTTTQDRGEALKLIDEGFVEKRRRE